MAELLSKSEKLENSYQKALTVLQVLRGEDKISQLSYDLLLESLKQIKQNLSSAEDFSKQLFDTLEERLDTSPMSSSLAKIYVSKTPFIFGGTSYILTLKPLR